MRQTRELRQVELVFDGGSVIFQKADEGLWVESVVGSVGHPTNGLARTMLKAVIEIDRAEEDTNATTDARTRDCTERKRGA